MPESLPPSELPKKLAKRMKQQGFANIYSLAKAIGKDDAGLMRNVRGERTMSLTTALQILKVLGFEFKGNEPLEILEELSPKDY